MKKIFFYLIPGLFQLQNKKIFSGLAIFTMVFSPILLIIKLEFFSENLETFIYHYFAYSIFSFGIIAHFAMIIIKKTELVSSVSPENLYEKGRLSCLKGNYELALLHFEKLYKITPNDEDVIYQLGKIYIELGNHKRASLLYKNYLKGKNTKWKKEIEIIIEELGKTK